MGELSGAIKADAATGDWSNERPTLAGVGGEPKAPAYRPLAPKRDGGEPKQGGGAKAAVGGEKVNDETPVK